MDRLLSQFFDLQVAIKYLPAMAAGLLVTLELAAFVIVTGLILGLALAIVRTARIRVVDLMIVAYADVLRCIPALTLMFVFFFAMPLVGVRMSGTVSAWLALSLVLAAFSEEIFWTTILAVHRDQWEAARATGLSFRQTLAYVVLPQALRIALPPITNRTIAITKGVALASAVAVPEMLGEAIASVSYSSNSTPLMMAAAAYLAIFLPLARLSRWVEHRIAWKG